MRNWSTFSITGILSFVLGSVAVWWIYGHVQKASIEPPHSDPAVFVSVSPVPADPRNSTGPVSEIDISNPYAIANAVDGSIDLDVEEVWRRLGISSEIGEGFFSKCTVCSAEAFEFNLDDSPQNEIVVRIANSLEECRYLVFAEIKSNRTKYKLIGNIDHDFGRYQMPSHHFVVSKGRAYLVVRGQTVSGSGVAAYNYRLFRVKGGRLEELLEFPADGHQSLTTADPTRDWSTRVRSVTPLTNGATRIELDLMIDYALEDYDGDGPVLGGHWTKRERAVFYKPAGGRRAYVDRRKSTVTQHQIEAEYNIDSLNDIDLVRYNRSQLRYAKWKPFKRDREN